MSTDLFDRLDPTELTVAQLAPLESLIPQDWPDVWRELATSHYITLVSAPGSETVQPEQLARLAVALALGIAADLGGTQPYIPVGALLAASSKARRVVELLEQGASYRDVSIATGLTESRVRRIQSDWRRTRWLSRQGTLQLD